ncbi:hypothetical protein [Kordia sp.]|uniref:hypothetical protein n=1 Tax=Kordia sp. TaxID=1965332 RepID=UPI003D281F17
MRIIALRGEGNCGKTTTLNLVYDDLIAKGATVFIAKKQVGGDKRDFETVLIYHGKKIAFFTMGDYSIYLIEAIIKYEALKVDILICASNIKFVKPIKKIVTYNHNLVIKSIASPKTKTANSIENNKDATTIVGLI